MLVYVLHIDGSPLMPCSPRKARLLLKENKATVVKLCPFTIQLNYNTGKAKEVITLGIDMGSQYIGLSATTDKQELFKGLVELRTDTPDLLSTRREMRRTRRNRKTRYRKPRFLNRKRKDGWLSPTLNQKVDSHLNMVKRVNSILPISKIIVEAAKFDIQKIKNPTINGTEYQQGEQLDFWNVREYVLFRDNHICQCCKGKSKDKILNVHHIESRKTGGNAPNNLITLCETCHKDYHNNTLKYSFNPKRGMSFRDASQVNIFRKTLISKLKELFPNILVSSTYGYITKSKRINLELPKEHYIDAYCIANNLSAKLSDILYQYKCKRSHNRQIHKMQYKKGGVRPLNILPKYMFGYKIGDKVSFTLNDTSIIGFVTSRRKTGSFTISDLDGEILKGSITHKKLKLLECSSGILCTTKILSNQ